MTGMASVGLLYLGGVLLLDGCVLLGWVQARAAGPLNLFVGALLVVTPTYLIFTANGDQDAILSASGLYLLGFTFLYLGITVLTGADSTGAGFFSAFVAVCALVYSGLSFGRLDDNAFGVIWLCWAFLWGLLFAVLGLKRAGLTRYTGAVAATQGVATAVVPAFLLLTGAWAPHVDTAAIVLAVFAVTAFSALWMQLRPTTRLVIPEQQRDDAPSAPTRTSAGT